MLKMFKEFPNFHLDQKISPYNLILYTFFLVILSLYPPCCKLQEVSAPAKPIYGSSKDFLDQLAIFMKWRGKIAVVMLANLF